MKKAFTLVELLISITIVVLALGGGIIYFNNFNQRQKVERTEKQIVTDLELVQSYARTRQVPIGFTGGDLAYVQVQISEGNLVAGANGIGATFFSDKLPYVQEIDVGVSPAVIYYWAGSGKVSSDVEGNFLGDNERVRIQIQRNDSQIGYKEIRVNVLGQIEYLGYRDGVADFSEVTTYPTVTMIPSPTIDSCRTLGVECRDDVDCCSGNCYGGFCADVSPTGTETCADPGQTNPHYIEDPPYSGNCVTVNSCGNSDQFCL